MKQIDPNPQIQNNSVISAEEVDHPVVLLPYTISFYNYLDKECQIDNLEKSSHKKALKWMIDIKNCFNKDEVIRANSFKNTPIDLTNSYAFLSIEDGIEVREVKISGSGRLFYYINDANRTINCRVLLNTHLETKKIKRK